MKHLLSLLIIFSFLACSKSNPIPKESTTSSTSYVDKAYLQTLDFKGKESISVYIEGQHFYINKSGKKISTLTYNGEADKFSDGLARTKVNGKIGFFNKNLEVILKPQYDFAFPFHKGISEICMGCKEEEEGDESMLNGGAWKKIDRDGLVVE